MDLLLRISSVFLILWMCVGTSFASVSQTGTPGFFYANTNTGSTSITVPSGADIVVFGISGWESGINSFYSGGTMTVNGSGCTVGRADDGDFNFDFTAIFYCVSPPSGSQTVAWDWSGTNTPSDETVVHYSFYTGVDTSNPIRSSGGQATTGTSASAGTLTATSGDYAFGVAYAYDNGLPTNMTWTGLTEQADFTATGNAPADNRTSYADSAMTGNTAMSVSQSGGGGASPYTTMSAIVLRQSTGPSAPTVTTDSVSPITLSSATVNGNVTSDGGDSVTDRGVCYATTASPTTPCTSSGTGTGTFTVGLTGLSGGTIYYARSFATNSVGTSYGSDISFTPVIYSRGNYDHGLKAGNARWVR